MYLAVPLRQPGSTEVQRDAERDSTVRSGITELEARDSSGNSGQPALLEVASLRTRLMAERDAADGFARIPIAHLLECRADKRVMLEDRYIATVLDARAAPRLATFMTELLGTPAPARRGARPARVTATGALRARRKSPTICCCRPSTARRRCSPTSPSRASCTPRTCTASASHSPGSSPPSPAPRTGARRFPRYRHERLRESFEPVIAALRAAFSVVHRVERDPDPDRRQEVRHQRRHGRATGVAVRQRGVRARGARRPAGRRLRRRFPGLLKIGPVEKISDYVNLQLPGISGDPVPVAPRQIPVHAGFVYFELDQTHELWNQLANSGGVAFHVAGDMPGLALEFWAIRAEERQHADRR